MRKILNSLVRIAIGVGIGIPLVLFPYFYFAQESLLFPAPFYDPAQNDLLPALYSNAEEIRVTASDGVVLHGWLVKSGKADGKMPMLIYFSGNSELADDFPIQQAALKDWGILMINYRGYGKSEGKPSEQALVADAVLLYDTLTKRTDVDTTRIVAMGRSLGSGVAVKLAHERPLRAVILATPYDSIRAVAQDMLPYIPVSIILKHPFDSLALAPKINTPMLCLIAGDDTLIPPPHGKRLAKAWGGPTDVQILPGVDHDTIYGHPHLWRLVRDFLHRTAGS
ncbi:MAG: alpha/beta hydrolase [Magnetococcales bacterium]|nr:alpha/beta hydrolase [Magnetococcales bacterium]NGZ27612.1 alpha/beta hydrolase [Magnetococcales bacterium]